MYTVSVLLSTYNGEEYICSQLDSILNQRDVQVKLLIRDDGSTDQTPFILREYALEHDNITFFRGKNSGVAASFFRLFELADGESDYYALADQDDVWDTDKLSIACSRLSALNASEEEPVMYCCAAQNTDANLHPLEDDDYTHTALIPDFKNALIENIARGGGIVFNPALMNSVRIAMPKDVYMHDWWLYLVSSCFGQVIYDPEAHYKYRQHAGNVLGAAPSGASRLKRRLKQSRTNGGHILRQAEAFARTYRIPAEKQPSVDVILQYRTSFRCRMKGFSGKYLFRQSKSDNFIFRLLFFTNHL